jgi:thiol-disulfide isomerase/thioredoxin
MNFKKRACALALLSLALVPGCEAKDKATTSAQAQPPQAQNRSKVPPDFSLPSVAVGPGAGKEIRLSSYKGKVVLLDFWATWCGPCRMEIPHFVELQKQYGKKGFTLIGVSLDQQGEAVVKPFMQQWKINYPMVIDAAGEVQASYGGIRSIPTTVLIGKNGEVREVFIGYRPKELFEEAIKKALLEI